MKVDDKIIVKMFPILLGISAILYLINQLVLNGWHTWEYYTRQGSHGTYTLFEVIQRNPLIGVALLIIPIAIFLYYLINKCINNEKFKLNVLIIILFLILEAFMVLFDFCMLFIVYT